MCSSKPVIVILSAARSGSKLFRDVLSQHPEIASIPYDVNYIWKYGNYHSDDELKSQDLTVQISAFIQNEIFKHTNKESKQFIVEKTVSNTLRVDFVREVFPHAKFIHLYRDGRDVAFSARNCWTAATVSSANQSRAILLKKIFRYPYLATYPYIIGKINEKLRYKLGIDDQSPVWGPEFEGIRVFMNEHNLLQVCAKQWSECVLKTLLALEHLNFGNDYVSISYEDFVMNPEKSLLKIQQLINISDVTPMLRYANHRVDKNYIEKWRTKLTAQELASINPIIIPTLRELGYSVEKS